MRQLQPFLQQAGVGIQYRINGDLKQVLKPTSEQLMWILMYADDIALISGDAASLKAAIGLLDTVFSDWGLTVSTAKTKLLVIGRDAQTQAANLSIQVHGDTLEVVHKFKYLGSIFMSDGTLDVEINHRIASAGIAWHQLKSGKVWSSKYVTLARKVLMFRSVVLTVLLYGCETWPALDSHIQRLEMFQMNCLRFLCGFTWRDHKSNETVRHSCNLPSIAGEVRFRRLKWLGHVARMPDERQPVQALFGQLIGPGVRPPTRVMEVHCVQRPVCSESC